MPGTTLPGLTFLPMKGEHRAASRCVWVLKDMLIHSFSSNLGWADNRAQNRPGSLPSGETRRQTDDHINKSDKL